MAEQLNAKPDEPINRDIIPEYIMEEYFARQENDPIYTVAARMVVPKGSFGHEQFERVELIYQELRRAQSAMMYLHDVHGTAANDLYKPVADFFTKRIDQILHPEDTPLHDT